MGVRACCNDIREREIQVPQRRKWRLQLTRQLLERNPSIVIKLSLSDR
jgi:hypothetical protein